MCNMTVHIPQKAQLDPLEVLCVKFEDTRTSTFRDMLRKRNVHGRPNAVTSSFLLCDLAY